MDNLSIVVLFLVVLAFALAVGVVHGVQRRQFWVILTDAMDVMFYGFTELPDALHKASGASKEQLQKRINQTKGSIYTLCRGEITEEEFWQNFVNGAIWSWTNEKGDVLEVCPDRLKEAFRNNMKRSVPGVLKLYQRLHVAGIQFYLASDHFNEMVPLLIEWHPEVFGRIIPKGNLFWSCELGMVKQDSEFFPYVLDMLRSRGIGPGNIIFIDDNLKNVKEARENKIAAIQFKSAGQLEEALKEIGLKF